MDQEPEELDCDQHNAPFFFLGGSEHGRIHKLSVELTVVSNGPEVYERRKITWPGVMEGESMDVFVSRDAMVNTEWLATIPPAVLDALWPKDISTYEKLEPRTTGEDGGT